MKQRPFWMQKIEQAWRTRSVVWLSGVRRVGKTTLAKMFNEAVYLNCDLPSVERRLLDPESFFDDLPRNSTVIFDEVHQMEDPSRLLKIAADAYPHLKILATGSSTLAASKKFRDTLTGRKHEIYLPPVLWTECGEVFGIKALDKRLLHGGLPEPLLSRRTDAAFFSEWIDSFYARDIQELFALRNRVGFLKLFHLLLRQSGGMVDYSSLAKMSGLAYPTVRAHVEAMTIAHAVFLLPPFHGGGRREIIAQPKAYAFDTGFVAHIKGWESIREDDRGLLWEHLVLDGLRSRIPSADIYFWRDKSNREIDFVIQNRDGIVHAVECKINPDQFEPRSLSIFRESYPNGENYVIGPNIKDSFKRRFHNLIVIFCPLDSFASQGTEEPSATSNQP
jgi:predicted AAA+ superfamily ATPase